MSKKGKWVSSTPSCLNFVSERHPHRTFAKIWTVTHRMQNSRWYEVDIFKMSAGVFRNEASFKTERRAKEYVEWRFRKWLKK